jgi:hypothetical protein
MRCRPTWVAGEPIDGGASDGRSLWRVGRLVWQNPELESGSRKEKLGTRRPMFHNYLEMWLKTA